MSLELSTILIRYGRYTEKLSLYPYFYRHCSYFFRYFDLLELREIQITIRNVFNNLHCKC